MEQLAEFASRHALILFGALLLAALAVVAALWHLLQRYGEALWRRIGQLWQALRKSALAHRVRARWPRATTMLAKRLRPGSFLTLHLVIGAALCFFATSGFLELADELTEQGNLAAFDRAFSAGLRASLDDTALRAFYAVTRLGDPLTLGVIGGIVALWLGLWRRDGLMLAAWIAAIGGNGILVRALKELFHRDRPLHDHGLFTVHGWSFPSGHAAGALAVYGMLAYVLVRTLPPALRMPTVVIAVALVLVVGHSRVFLQVHYFSDVMAGYAVALAWLSVCIAGAEMAIRHRARRRA